MSKRHIAIAPAVVLAMVFSGGTGATPPPLSGKNDFYKSHHSQHGLSTGHLPASRHDVDLVGKLRLVGPPFDGDISDVSALRASDGRWYAYLGNWGAKCETGGVHIVDITDPTKPQRVGFLNASGFGYPDGGGPGPSHQHGEVYG